MAQIDPRKFLKGDTKQVTILSTATESSEAIFDKEYAFFKITPITITGFPAAVAMTVLAGGKVVAVNTGIMTFTYPDEDFLWNVTLMCGVNNISIRLGVAATADIIFQITPYEAAQTE